MKRILLALVAPLLLTGCLLSPGKFASELQVMKDGSFSFSYDGEIQMLALSKLADMGGSSGSFSPEPCYTDEYEERECTSGELAAQERAWQDGAEQRAAEKKREAEQMRAFLGGIDPSSPEAAEEFAEILRRQRGWNSVEHKGEGLFEVSFAVSGQLGHDFAFPMIEKVPTTNLFVTAILRNEGQVRIEAPAFAAQNGSNPMSGMMGGMAGFAAMAAAEKSDDGEMPKIVTPEGTFRIVTDGRILANNTDEGPASDGAVQTLTWDINSRSEAGPTALIDLSD